MRCAHVEVREELLVVCFLLPLWDPGAEFRLLGLYYKYSPTVASVQLRTCYFLFHHFRKDTNVDIGIHGILPIYLF